MSSQIRWYNFLTSREKKSGEVKTDDKNQYQKVALMDKEVVSYDSLVVCQQKEFRTYACYASYNIFGRFAAREVKEEYRCFYEIIMGNHAQKPYFDIEFYVGDKQLENSKQEEKLTALPLDLSLDPGKEVNLLQQFVDEQ